LWTWGIRITTNSPNAGPHLIKTLTPFCIRGPERSDAMGYQEGLDPVQMTGALTHQSLTLTMETPSILFLGVCARTARQLCGSPWNGATPWPSFQPTES
jgi:hypothetical protein